MKLQERLLFGVPTLAFCFAVILLDSAGKVDVGKWGYSFIGGLIVTLINFYYRKSRTEAK